MPTRRGFLAGAAPGLTIGLAAWLVPASASAAVPSAARAAYQRGSWAEAAAIAGAQPAPDSLAFAARAHLAPVILAGASRAPEQPVRAARRLAQRALELSPRHIEGRLQLATALGIQSRRISPASAYLQRLPQRTRALLEAVLADSPREAWGEALLGGWHLEGLRIGGQDAQRFLGADLAAGRAAFSRAMALAPDEPAIPFFYACSLLAIDGPGNVTDSRELVGRALASPASDAFNRQIIARARQLAPQIAGVPTVATQSLLASWM
jgi:hypothetical protein